MDCGCMEHFECPPGCQMSCLQFEIGGSNHRQLWLATVGPLPASLGAAFAAEGICL